MTMTRAELEEAALAFADLGLAPAADASAEAIGAMGWLSMEVPDADRASQVLVESEGRIALVPLADCRIEPVVIWDETRRRFDRPLAMFQALKHRVADLKTRLSAAEALFWSRAGGAPSLMEPGALKALASTVYRDVAEEAIQLHGGIGLTMGHPCHLFLKRALLNCALGGDADRWEERAGRALLARMPQLPA